MGVSGTPMSGTREVLTAGGRLLSAQILVNVLSFAVSIWVVRTLTKEDLAVFPVASLLAGIVTVISSLGLPSICLRTLAGLQAEGRDHEADALIRRTLVTTAAAALVLSGSLFLMRHSVAALLFKDAMHGALVGGLAPLVFLEAINNAGLLVLQSVRRFGVVSLVTITSSVVLHGFTIPFYLLFSRKGLVLSLSAASIVTCALLIWSLRKSMSSARLSHPPGGAPVRLSLALYAFGGVRFLVMNADSLLVVALLSPAQLAVLFVAKKFAGWLSLLIEIMFRPFLPKLSELRVTGGESVSRAFRKASAWIFYALLPTATALALLAGPLVMAYAGPEYADAAMMLTLLAAGQFLYAVYSLYATHVFVLETPGRPLFLEATSGVVSLATAFICIGVWGTLGAAVGPIVTFSLGTVVAHRLLSERGDYVLPAGAVSAASLACALMAAPLYICVALADGDPMVLTTIPLFALLYVVIVTYLMPSTDLTDLASALSPRGNAFLRIVQRMRPKTS